MRALACCCLALCICLGQAAYAADTSAAGSAKASVAASCAKAADSCCRAFRVVCIELKYRPLCPPPHRCPTPLIPCPPCLELKPVCHKPLLTCFPDAPCICIGEVCHKPAEVTELYDPCAEQR